MSFLSPTIGRNETFVNSSNLPSRRQKRLLVLKEETGLDLDGNVQGLCHKAMFLRLLDQSTRPFKVFFDLNDTFKPAFSI